MRRRWLTMIMLLAPTAHAHAADVEKDKAAPQVEAFRALNKEFRAAMKAHGEELKAKAELATKEGKDLDPALLVGPGAAFSARFLELAEKDPEGPAAVDALVATLQSAAGFKGPKAPTWGPAIALLREHYLTRPEVEPAVKALSAHDDDPEAHRFLRDVIDKNPDRKLQVRSVQTLMASLESTEKLSAMLRQNIEKDPAIRARAEKILGKDGIAEAVEKGGRAKKEREKLASLLKSRYSDLVADLSVGRPAPALVGETLDGKAVRLADYKGKVVVLDVWATWCGPCRAMIPHEREMVERLKGEPFVLVSISADAEKETLVDFLDKEPMPWTHWWNGAEGKILDALNIQHYPTIFVLDREGVIRYKEVRGQELEDAVKTLLGERTAARPEPAAAVAKPGD
jgi:thiol-disulfide isomerase/thioredoxin